jgi:hypothetical protein
MIKNFFYAILDVFARVIALLLGLLGFGWVTSGMILGFFFRYAVEIMVFFAIGAFWPMAGFPIVVLNPFWGLLFFPAFHLFGPKEENDPPQNFWVHNISAVVACLLPPWGLYMQRKWRELVLTTIALAVVQAISPVASGQVYWAAVLGSLFLVLWGIKSLRRWVIAISSIAIVLVLVIQNPGIALDMVKNLILSGMGILWWAGLSFGLPVITWLVWKYARS